MVGSFGTSFSTLFLFYADDGKLLLRANVFKIALINYFSFSPIIDMYRTNKENRLEEKEVPSNMLEVDVTEADSVLPADILYMLKSIK